MDKRLKQEDSLNPLLATVFLDQTAKICKRIIYRRTKFGMLKLIVRPIYLQTLLYTDDIEEILQQAMVVWYEELKRKESVINVEKNKITWLSKQN